MSRITVKDIAKKAKVSAQSVSYALTGCGRIGEDTAQRIRAIADKMGYVPMQSGRTMRGLKSKLVGIVIGNGTEGLVDLINHIQGHGYDCFVQSTANRKTEDVMRAFQSRSVEAIIFLGKKTVESDIPAFSASGAPSRTWSQLKTVLTH